MPTYRELNENEFYLLNAALDLKHPDLNELPYYYAEFRDAVMAAICEYPQGKLWVRDKGGNDRWAVVQNGDLYYAVTQNLQQGVPLMVLRKLEKQLMPWEWRSFLKNWIVGPAIFLALPVFFIIHPPRPIPFLGWFDYYFVTPWFQGAVAFITLATIIRQLYKPLQYYQHQQELSLRFLKHFTAKTPEELRAETERFAGKQPKF